MSEACSERRIASSEVRAVAVPLRLYAMAPTVGAARNRRGIAPASTLLWAADDVGLVPSPLAE